MCATRDYSMEQAVSNVVDEQSPNALDAHRDSVEEFVLFLFIRDFISVWDFLRRVYPEWIVNKCKKH